MLNNFCGDAWCEGAYDIQFNSIQLNHSASVFVLAAATTADPSDESTANSIPFQCHMDDSLIENVIQAQDSEALYQSQSELFNAISDCIAAALYRRR